MANTSTHAPDVRRDTILVVDDTPETLGFLTDTLDHAGFTVLSPPTARARSTWSIRSRPTSCSWMPSCPGMNGFETCRRLKRNKMLAHLPVIFMTGLSETENVLEGLAAGGVDYVTKPIVVDELLARIRVHLANARVAAGTRAALDATGRFLLATDRTGRLLWCTPKARQLLAELFPAASEQQREPAGRHRWASSCSCAPEGGEHALAARRQRPQGGDLRAEPHRAR